MNTMTMLLLTAALAFAGDTREDAGRKLEMKISLELRGGKLSDAARIDGCSEFAIFWRIVLPLSKPALIVVALFTFMGAWNDFLGPLVYLQRPEQYTLALGLRSFQQEYGTDWNLLMAASLVTMLPVLVLFFVAQRYFIRGIVFTGIKG